MLSRFKNSYFSYVLLYTGYYLVFSLYSSVLAVYLTRSSPLFFRPRGFSPFLWPPFPAILRTG